jgi:hypothetical protein
VVFGNHCASLPLVFLICDNLLLRGQFALQINSHIDWHILVSSETSFNRSDSLLGSGIFLRQAFSTNVRLVPLFRRSMAAICALRLDLVVLPLGSHRGSALLVILWQFTRKYFLVKYICN